MKKNENKKYILAAPGFEPTTLSGDDFAQNRNIYECPLATSGNVSSVQLAQSAPFQKKEFTTAGVAHNGA